MFLGALSGNRLYCRRAKQIYFCLYGIKARHTALHKGIAECRQAVSVLPHRPLARGIPSTPKYVATLHISSGHSPTAGKSPAYPIKKSSGAAFFVKRSAAKRVNQYSVLQIWCISFWCFFGNGGIFGQIQNRFYIAPCVFYFLIGISYFVIFCP